MAGDQRLERRVVEMAIKGRVEDQSVDAPELHRQGQVAIDRIDHCNRVGTEGQRDCPLPNQLTANDRIASRNKLVQRTLTGQPGLVSAAKQTEDQAALRPGAVVLGLVKENVIELAQGLFSKSCLGDRIAASKGEHGPKLNHRHYGELILDDGVSLLDDIDGLLGRLEITGKITPAKAVAEV